MKVEEIEHLKSLIAEEEKSIEKTQEKVVNILSDLFKRESSGDHLEFSNHMKVSHLHSLFRDEQLSENAFWKGGGEGEEKRRKLADERRAEYNAFLEQKELSARPKKPSTPQPSPRSILESVDYDKVLAKLKQEEARFRNLNYAEPSVEKKATEHQIPQKEAATKPVELHSLPKPHKVAAAPVEPPVHKGTPSRTGGGGDPVKDSFGNLITGRGFRESPLVGGGVLGFPSFVQESPNNRNSAYREELKRQIEEKRRLEAEERRRREEEEARLAARLELQRQQMLREYQSELQVHHNRALQLQQERLRQLEEFQRQDAAKRSQQRAMRPSTPPQPLQEPVLPPERPPSPPVPAVRSKVILERTVSPTATSTKALQQVKPETVFSSLAEIRRSIMKDQHNKDFKDSYEVTNRRTVPDVLDEYDD